MGGGDSGTPLRATGLARVRHLDLGLARTQREPVEPDRRGGSIEIGWTLAAVNSAAFAKSGYCSSKPLFVGIFGAAVVHWDIGGPFRPDREAHQIQAAEIEPALCEGVGLNGERNG